VKTQDGFKSIETIQSGDIVASANEHTVKISYKKVVQTFIRQTPRIYKLTYNDGTTVETTGDHPFFIQGKGWTNADSMASGDISPTWAGLKKSGGVVEKEIVFSASEDTISDRVSSLVMKESLAVVDIEVIEEETTVYNFEVEDDHTYFVTDAEVWVHNADQEKYNTLIEKLDQEMKTDAIVEKDWIDRLNVLAVTLVNPIAGALYSSYQAGSILLDTPEEIKILMEEAIESEREHSRRVFENENAAASRAIKDEQTMMKNLMSKYGISDINEANNTLRDLEKTQNILGITSIEDKELSSKINDLKAIQNSQIKISVYKKELEHLSTTFNNQITSLNSSGMPLGLNSSEQFRNEYQAILKLNESYTAYRLQSIDATALSSFINPTGFRAPVDYENYKKRIEEREKRNACSHRYGVYQSCQ
jgi:hypothetical protein